MGGWIGQPRLHYPKKRMALFQDLFLLKMQTSRVEKSEQREEGALGPNPGGSWSLYHPVSTVPVLPLLVLVHP